MKSSYFLVLIVVSTSVMTLSFNKENSKEIYLSGYDAKLKNLKEELKTLQTLILKNGIERFDVKLDIHKRIGHARNTLKKMDFWLRYLEPVSYKKLNGPLPVEWETEVFEKFEKPYKRYGAGLTLAALYLKEDKPEKDSVLSLFQESILATQVFAEDSITHNLKTFDHFYLCNRLFLLNLAAIYTTGFECPDAEMIVPELRLMLSAVLEIYLSFDDSFPEVELTSEYLILYKETMAFTASQPSDFSLFDHFTFIKNYINPLFALNQQAIRNHKVRSKSFVDYSLNKSARTIFNKQLYNGQNAKGIFLRVDDEIILDKISEVGKLLFYDPILSGNNQRSCVSCHKSKEYFADTLGASALQFNRKDRLKRNTPSLINATYNHLIMLDGAHTSLQDQTMAVIKHPEELGATEKDLVQKVLSCPDYQKIFRSLLPYTPTESEITAEHITSAITYYYSRFSTYYSPFDKAVNENARLPLDAQLGFNIFMSKAQCATCHFVPQFNGVKPPYVGSEFEVLGVPVDTAFSNLSPDKGRFLINPAVETMNAFRTGSLRNIQFTGPYMHNGVFKTLDQVITFYDEGGGAGKGLIVPNQTLSSDSLQLTKKEKLQLIAFLQSLNEDIAFDEKPVKLPKSKIKILNARKVGGEY